MARKRAKTRTIIRKVKVRSRSRKSKGIFGDAGRLLGAGAYGAVRGRLAQAVSPLLANIPGGAIADEIGMLGVAWAAKKFIGGKVPFVADMAKAGMVIEAAAIGQALSTGALNTGQVQTARGFR